jgi:hypothetical protein
LTTKTPKDASAAKPKKETKSKKKASEEAEAAQPEEPPLTEEEKLAKREKQGGFRILRSQCMMLTKPSLVSATSPAEGILVARPSSQG